MPLRGSCVCRPLTLLQEYVSWLQQVKKFIEA